MRADPDRQEELEEVSASPRSTSPPTNNTPLLTATLNAPLQSYYSGGAVRVKCPTDLHVTLTKKPKSEPCEQGGSSQAVFYSTLLKQLRQKAGDVIPTNQQVQTGQKVKKEKSKALPFQCPACKKRFQRHIAMNAHIQNEHISAASAGGERSCRLCGSGSGSMAAVRLHLLTSHGIDLDNPAMCVVEEKRYTREEEDLPSCSNLDMSGSSASCSPAHTPSSREAIRRKHLFLDIVQKWPKPPPQFWTFVSESPERVVYSAPCRPEDDEMQVEDLSVRRPCAPSPQLVRAPVSPRPESPCLAKQAAKRPRLRESSPSPTFSSSSTVSSPSSASSRYTCTHCNIVYPNQTLYFLHKGFHSEANPWRCNSCGQQSADLYDFNTHLFSVAHQ